jgi:peptidoglycan hydrolase-like protein with peptidoglycan-binding domain
VRLKSLGYYRQKVDGVWGPKSAAALSSFRRDAGLGSNIAWDLATQSVLMGAKQ